MSFNIISFIKRATLGAVPVADDQPLPTKILDSSNAAVVWDSDYVRLTNSGPVKSGAGVLDRIVVSAAGTTITINVYDNTAGSGTLIFGPYVLVAGVTLTLGTKFGTGCYITFSATTGTPSLTATYR